MNENNSQLESLCREFDAAWRDNDHPPDINQFYAREAVASWDAERKRRLLCELIGRDLDFRWRMRGEAAASLSIRTASSAVPPRPRVEDYLRLFPWINDRFEDVKDLLVYEYEVRVSFGDGPEPVEYLNRFPRLGAEFAGFLFGLKIKKAAQSAQSLDSEQIVKNRYRLIEQVGKGGFGQVWLAWDNELHRNVALKFPSAPHGQDLLGNIVHEARKAAKLTHPGIVTVFDVDAEESRPFIVSELVQGGDLAQLIPKAGFEFAAAAGIVARVAEAVQHAHDNGLVHGDLKPANILIDEKLQPHVTDFGLSVVAREEPTGAAGGTLNYMAPEQFDGRVGRASDVFALGAILYELLTGRRANPADSFEDAKKFGRLAAIVPPSLLRTKLPVDLETITLKALHLEPDRRYPTALALASDLENWMKGLPIKARSVRPIEKAWLWARRNRGIAGLTMGVALLMCAITTVSSVGYLRIRSAERSRAKARLETYVLVTSETASAMLNELKRDLPTIDSALDQIPVSQSDTTATIRIGLIKLLAGDRSQLPIILEASGKTDDPFDLMLLGKHLDDHRQQAVSWLNERLVILPVGSSERLRALALLAGLQARDLSTRDAAEVAAGIISADALRWPAWASVFESSIDRLRPPLEERFRDATTAQEQIGAATLLASIIADPSEKVLLATSGNDEQFNLMFRMLADSANQEILDELRARLSMSEDTVGSTIDKVRRSSSRAFSAIALLRLGGSFNPESIFDSRQVVRDAATRFIHAHDQRLVSPRQIWELLRKADSAEARYGLVLALGEHSPYIAARDPAPFSEIVPTLAAWYASDPDPGVHAACGWLLRAWRHEDIVREVDARDWPYDAVGDRRWFVETIAGRRTTFVVLPPSEFNMGSPEWEDDRETPVPQESLHAVKLTRAFAISSSETTAEQFEQFMKVGSRVTETFTMPSYLKPQAPITEVNWIQAMSYCAWLNGTLQASEAGIDPTQLDYLDNVNTEGFRLPTEAEWEYACRAGASSAFSFGWDATWLDNYAWNQFNADRDPHPVQQLRPNRWGLFDMHGNAMEWVFDASRAYQPSTEPSEDPLGRFAPTRRMMRGGSYSNPAPNHRCAFRYPVDADEGRAFCGFRMVRVLANP